MQLQIFISIKKKKMPVPYNWKSKPVFSFLVSKKGSVVIAWPVT